ncbi:MAG: RnfABCDGE type electron transport complex subunit D [Bacilli bacterium]|nr:RnfABCDGE type electron transport complex subunit D [Bacilli bacterium]
MNFNTPSKTFVKSSNSINKFNNNYLYTLIIFLLYIILYNLLIKENIIVLSILKTLSISILTSIFIYYIVKLITKDKLKKDMTINYLISISIIITLFSYKEKIIITIIATIISLIIKKIHKNINLSATLYGILFIYLYKYISNDLITPLTNLTNYNYVGTYQEIIKSNGTILSYLLGINYLSPILSIIIFFYLFYKKSIKYSLYFSYILTFSSIMLLFGLFNNMNVYYLFFELTTGNILFLSTYLLTDMIITPTISKGQIIYGIILGIITSILRFIIPELSVIITLIIGPILLTKYIDKLSIKYKYNEKYYLNTLIICFIVIIITIISLSIIF